MSKIITWTSDILDNLGKYSDNELSEKSGISRKSIARKREELNIPKFEYKFDKHSFINGVEYKKCSGCQEDLELNKFHKNSSRWDGLSSYCKDCVYDYNQERLHSNNDVRHNYLNKLKLKRISKFSDENINKTGEEFKEHVKLRRRFLEKLRKRKDRKDNPDKYKNYPSSSKNARRQYNLKYKPKYKNSFVFWNSEQEEIMFEVFGRMCVWCGCSENEHKKIYNSNLELDHFIPVKYGGKTEPGNICPCCKNCNRGKDGKFDNLPDNWAVSKFGEALGKQKYSEIIKKLEEHKHIYEKM